ncbi:hypothetical protein RQN30_10655 [Arcanobacterium hippocoleae]
MNLNNWIEKTTDITSTVIDGVNSYRERRKERKAQKAAERKAAYEDKLASAAWIDDNDDAETIWLWGVSDHQWNLEKVYKMHGGDLNKDWDAVDVDCFLTFSRNKKANTTLHLEIWVEYDGIKLGAVPDTMFEEVWNRWQETGSKKQRVATRARIYNRLTDSKHPRFGIKATL